MQCLGCLIVKSNLETFFWMCNKEEILILHEYEFHKKTGL